MTVTAQPTGAGAGAGQKGLKGDALGLLSSTVIGISSVAPAYSLASALGFVVLDVGVHSAAVMVLAFVPMLLVAFAYQQLNKEMPDCGSTFTWGTKAFGPRTGWMGGWGILAADIIVMANLGAIAGQYMFELFGANGLAGSQVWLTVAGVAWIVGMCAICYAGIEISARVQYVLLVIEVVMLIVFSVVALVRVNDNTAPVGHLHPAIGWLNPFGVHSFSALTAGLLLAIFIYWGWDTAVSLNEETQDKGKVPGQAAVISTLILLVTYVLVSVAATAFAGIGTKGIGLANPDHNGDVLSVLGSAVFGRHGFGFVLAKLLVLMVLSSSAASTLTTIMPTARTSLSMAAYRAIPVRFATIQRRFLTPSWSTVGMAVASVAFYVAMELISTNVLQDTIDALGLMIAFYYGLTGFACAWWFRRDLRNSVKELFLKGIFPFLGGAILLLFFVKGLDYDWAPINSYSTWKMPLAPHWRIGGTFLTGVGALVVGVVLMEIYRLIAPAFFRGETLNKDTPVLVPDLDDSQLANRLAQASDPRPPIGSVSPGEVSAGEVSPGEVSAGEVSAGESVSPNEEELP